MKPLLAAIVVFSLFFSCYRPITVDRSPKVEGYRAVYSNDAELKQIRFTAPKKMTAAGKIYVKGKMILQNDLGTGIHLYDASDPAQLKDRGFIQIPGNLELSIKGNFLYANSYYDLVVIDLANWLDLKEVKRVPGAFSQQQSPDFSNVYFVPIPEMNAYYECVDPSKGLQVGWEKATIQNCYNQFN